MIEEITKYVNSMKLRNGKFSKASMQEVADHFGGTVTSGGRYVKIDGEEYQIYVDAFDMRLKVRHMTWKHGNNWTYSKPY